MTSAQIKRLRTIEQSARVLLNRIDHVTSDEFSLGGERAEREALRRALEAKQS